jgi:cytoplasmic iron level regulating protein YaaA (DUF328/UPF0246 family)
MLILLPPSETKRDGGDGPPLAQGLADHSLAFPELNVVRNRVAKAVVALAKKPAECVQALKLGPKQLGEIDRNREVLDSATMPAVDRYTGVLYDGLGAIDLPTTGRRFLADHVLIQSALLGPVGALDLIPAYRLSFDSKLPSLSGGSLKNNWKDIGSKALQQKHGLILDLRSEGYSGLSPVTPSNVTFYLRVMAKGVNGQLRALNHFNKKSKGEFVKALANDGAVTSNITTIDELTDWAISHHFYIERGLKATSRWPEELNLFIS